MVILQAALLVILMPLYNQPAVRVCLADGAVFECLCCNVQQRKGEQHGKLNDESNGL